MSTTLADMNLQFTSLDVPQVPEIPLSRTTTKQLKNKYKNSPLKRLPSQIPELEFTGSWRSVNRLDAGDCTFSQWLSNVGFSHNEVDSVFNQPGSEKEAIMCSNKIKQRSLSGSRPPTVLTSMLLKGQGSYYLLAHTKTLVVDARVAFRGPERVWGYGWKKDQVLSKIVQPTKVEDIVARLLKKPKGDSLVLELVDSSSTEPIYWRGENVVC
ncbi:MAG: hypothetical protein LQ340_007643 [Diploschistes diacapsis]|nr:MAG: hypothetical protein LQ340_007643 [Diploschistes diacapsis]